MNTVNTVHAYYKFDSDGDTDEISRRFEEYSKEVEAKFLLDVENLKRNNMLTAKTFNDVFGKYVMREFNRPYFRIENIVVKDRSVKCNVVPTMFNPYSEDYRDDEEILTIYFE